MKILFASKYLPLGTCHFPEARFSKVPKLFGPEKPFVKLWPAYSVKPLFSYVINPFPSKEFSIDE